MTATSPTDRLVYHDGEFLPEADVGLSVGTQALHYGTGVFEGIRAYWSPEHDRLWLLRAAEHYQRMADSARLLRIDLGHTVDELVEVSAELLRRTGHRGDIYLRPLAAKRALEPGTRFGVRLQGVSSGLTVQALPMGDYTPAGGLRCTVTSWRRIPDSSVPSRAKVTGGYVNNALAMDEAAAGGFDDVIFLNQRGDVAEASTANLFLVRDGRAATPGADADILPGITRAAVLELLPDEFGIPVQERTVARSELYTADEVFLVGTGCQIVPVTEIDGHTVGAGVPGSLTEKLRSFYGRLVRGHEPRYRSWLTPVELHG
ncbi:branched-chain amino acid transaminase [Streptomyces sp. NBC_00059]|uniref:branched-chain amino acid transaminase n=1 Tax=Streptomyces sp. NBC_00059 TaxID=2975635 RepID=UPI002259EB15|nr:branched-chain amino acid transaminase [Streptomyces sp. NBC_00059]MCX5415804.1 branched-chain amino acid transaminase [Streptomyces sp. NBC_00059]